MICKWLGTKALFGLARGWWALIAAILTVALALFILSALTGGKTARTEAKLARNQTEAAIASGMDAVATIGAQGAAEDDVDALTRENDHAIRNAQGADAPVSDALATAGMFSLCKRAAYRLHPECMQFTVAGGVEGGRSGRTAP
ncbi:MAG: hypothetical protein PHE36_09325 [Novosphingobium sp.]|nr:hypothetical protein [Novosphingobium sp.]